MNEMNETFNERYTPPIKFGCHISKKDDGQKCLKRTKKNTLISTQQILFFVLSSVHAEGKTDSTTYCAL